MSKMYLWGTKDEHGTIKGTYYLPQLSRSQNVYDAFSSKVSDIVKTKKMQVTSNFTSLIIATDTAGKLSFDSNSLDYAFTDPPYADNIQYGELNFIWESWLGFDTHWHDDEIIINEVRGKTEEDWARMMKKAMSECYRVLKPGRWISLCYHDTSEGTWQLLQDIMAEVGFIPDTSDSVLSIDAGQKSYNQLVADKVSKRDLVINFRKPKPGEIEQIVITGNEDEKSFNEKVISLAKDYLSSNPGSTIDRIYDSIVSKMVRRGEFERHNFKELLRQVSEVSGVEENGHARWYLKEDADIIDATEQAKEDLAAGIIETFMKKYLEEKAEKSGVHYSDIFERYLPVHDKPRRLLQEWMWDYFYKTPEGTWRPPANEEEREEKAKLRQSGLIRRIKRFANALIEGVPIREKDKPDSDITLAEWVRECRRAGLYEQGRAIYEKGGINLDNLDEERQLELEEDYELCVRRR